MRELILSLAVVGSGLLTQAHADTKDELRKEFRATALASASTFSQLGASACPVDKSTDFKITHENFNMDEIHVTAKYVIESAGDPWVYVIKVADGAVISMKRTCKTCS